MSDWCPQCECLTVENATATCSFCNTPVERCDPFLLASSVTTASTTAALVSTAVNYEGSKP